MREKSPKRHNVAVLSVIGIALVGFTLPALIKMATPERKEVMTEVVTLSQLEEPEIKQEEMKRVEPVAPPPPALKSSIKFTAPVIKKDEEVSDDDEMKSQKELTEAKVAISIADVKGNNGEKRPGPCPFVVGADGRVRDVCVLRSLDPYLDKEAVRVIMSMPKWIPGKQNGKAVSVKYTIPLVFKLKDE